MDEMESSNNYYIIQELCDGDLEHYMKSRKLSEAESIAFLKQICNGLLSLVK